MNDMKLKASVYYVLLAFVFSCNETGIMKKESHSETLFSIVPISTSTIDFTNTVEQTNDFSCLNYTYALIGGGVGVGDINNDGLEDIYFVSNQNSNKLYINK